MTSPRLGYPSDQRMKPQLGTSQGAKLIMPSGNADWLRGTPPITPAPVVIGRQSTILLVPRLCPPCSSRRRRLRRLPSHTLTPVC